MEAEEEQQGFSLVREDGLCGKQTTFLSSRALNPAECAALAQEAGSTAFSYGKSFAEGACFAQDLEVTEDVAKSFLDNRANPPCPSGEWTSSMLYDFYALEPVGATD